MSALRCRKWPSGFPAPTGHGEDAPPSPCRSGASAFDNWFCRCNISYPCCAWPGKPARVPYRRGGEEAYGRSGDCLANLFWTTMSRRSLRLAAWVRRWLTGSPQARARVG